MLKHVQLPIQRGLNAPRLPNGPAQPELDLISATDSENAVILFFLSVSDSPADRACDLIRLIEKEHQSPRASGNLLAQTCSCFATSTAVSSHCAICHPFINGEIGYKSLQFCSDTSMGYAAAERQEWAEF